MKIHLSVCLLYDFNDIVKFYKSFENWTSLIVFFVECLNTNGIENKYSRSHNHM